MGRNFFLLSFVENCYIFFNCLLLCMPIVFRSIKCPNSLSYSQWGGGGLADYSESAYLDKIRMGAEGIAI
jgi:hypothetical protein